MNARLLATAACAVVTLAALPARAGVEDTLALGPGAMALAGSCAARPGTYASTYYNPAGLAPGGGVVEKGGFFEGAASLVYAHPTLHVSGPGGREIATPETPDTAGVVVGTRFSVGQPFHLDGLDMGLAVYVPSHLFQWSIRPDDDVQWTLLTDRTQVLSAHAGIAYRLTRWLSLGVGLRVLFDVQTLTRGVVTSVALEPDPQTGKDVVRTHTQLGTDAQVFGRVEPLFGATITPVDRLRIGLVYRQASHVDDWGNTRISGVPDLGVMGYSHHFSHYFEPSEMTLAVGVDAGAGVDLSADLTYGLWSEALSTNRNFFGEGNWGNTLTPAFGARWRATPAFALMAGYRFQRSPVDNFGGPSNLLDADRHVGSLGFQLDLGKAFHWPSIDARVTAALMDIVLVEQSETKDFRRFPSDTALMKNPGYPSYVYGGHVLATSLGVEARW